MNCNNKLKAGFGMAEMVFPEDFFVRDDGSFEDGFCGKVHTFRGHESDISDDLCTRVMLLECGKRIAIAVVEVAQSPVDQVGYTKEIISRICSVKPEDVWVHTTHQFGFMHRPNDVAKAAVYDDIMKAAVEKAATEAMNSFTDAVVGIGTGESHVSANKNITAPKEIGGGPYFGPGSTLETNPKMTVLRFCSESTGENLGYFLSYGTKPSALCITGKAEGNRKVNTEVTGHASKLMEERFKVPCVFCMPAAGDQYPRETAQYFGFDADGNWKKIDIGFDEGIKIVDRLGQEMGEDAISIAEKVECTETVDEIKHGETVFEYANKAGEGNVAISLNCITMGRLAFVGFKQEMDCVTELQIQEASPYEVTLLVSFLNGDGKYLGHKEAYEFNNGVGTWETARSAYAVGAAEHLVEEAGRLLDSMKAGNDYPAPKSGECCKKQDKMFAEVVFNGMPWYVLDKKDDKALVLSKYILEKRAYNDTNENVTWESCSLREYLNGEFMERFSLEEKDDILETELSNPSNSKYATRGGNATADKVFLLSLEEAALYLGGFGQILSAAFENGKKDWWLLRSPGEAENVPASVDVSGALDYHGNGDSLEVIAGGIRPAVWLKCK